MVSDAGDAAQRVVRFGALGIHLADDRVFGTVDGGERRHRSRDAVATAMYGDGIECTRRVGESQFRCLGEQFDDVVESTVIDCGGVQVDEIGQREPVGGRQRHAVNPRRCAHADNRILATTM